LSQNDHVDHVLPLQSDIRAAGVIQVTFLKQTPILDCCVVRPGSNNKQPKGR
jgi:hypothetical protein